MSYKGLQRTKNTGKHNRSQGFERGPQVPDLDLKMSTDAITSSRFYPYLADLKSIDPNIYTRAAMAIRMQVEKDSRQMLADPRTLFISDLMSFIRNLATSSSYEDRLASLWVMRSSSNPVLPLA